MLKIKTSKSSTFVTLMQCSSYNLLQESDGSRWMEKKIRRIPDRQQTCSQFQPKVPTTPPAHLQSCHFYTWMKAKKKFLQMCEYVIKHINENFVNLKADKFLRSATIGI